MSPGGFVCRIAQNIGFLILLLMVRSVGAFFAASAHLIFAIGRQGCNVAVLRAAMRFYLENDLRGGGDETLAQTISVLSAGGREV